MAKRTLLNMVQNILSALDSDPVDSIDETVESVQVAEILKETFEDLMSQREWPFLFTLSPLEALGDTNNPTKMKIPDSWNKIKWLKYNKKEVEYLPPEEFKYVIDTRSATPNVVDSNGYGLNRDPQYWTSFDDVYIYFDSRDSSSDTTLQASKSIAYAALTPTWTHSDTFIPELPEKFFPTLLAEAKSQAFVNLKQTSNAREERKAQRGRMTMRNEAWKNEEGEIKYNRKVNYGRR
jgi:hypothetical protein